MTTATVMNSLIFRNQKSQLDVWGGPRYGTRYSMQDACKKCGTGAEQIGPLIMERFEMPSFDVFAILGREILISARLSALLRNAGMTCIGPVVDASTGTELECSQLVPEAILPPFSKRTTGYKREGQCRLCGRDGYFAGGYVERSGFWRRILEWSGFGRRIHWVHVPLELHYESLSAEALGKDLLATWERWGNSRLREPFEGSLFASPTYVAGPRLVDALKRANVEGLEFEPVFIDN